MCVRLILVLVLGRQTVYGQETVYLYLSTWIVFENTHTLRVTNAASEKEGVAAVSWIESWIDVIACVCAAVRTWCGGEMSISNAMLPRFASGVPYGFRDRQRFALVPKIT